MHFPVLKTYAVPNGAVAAIHHELNRNNNNREAFSTLDTWVVKKNCVEAELILMMALIVGTHNGMNNFSPRSAPTTLPSP